MYQCPTEGSSVGPCMVPGAEQGSKDVLRTGCSCQEISLKRLRGDCCQSGRHRHIREKDDLGASGGVLRWLILKLDARCFLRVDLGAWVSPIKHPAAQKGAVAGTLYAVGPASSDREHGWNLLSSPLGLVANLPVDLHHLPARVRE